MPGRIGDVVTDPALTPCSGCGKTTLLCEIEMERSSKQCCGWLCSHIHSLHTLALYGLLEK